jgi:tRNA (mo5U34)-methyltransferase
MKSFFSRRPVAVSSPGADDPRVPPAPAGFDADAFFAGTYWHQHWQLFQGIWTPGVNDVGLMCDKLQLPQDLTGKRVLDIGAWNGCLSFECERRGAREVIALGPENPQHTAFHRLRDALGSTRTHYRLGSVYQLDPDVLGHFDVVLFCGVLYHLRYPLLGIDNLRRVCTGEVYVETFMIDEQLVLNDRRRLENVPLAKLSRRLVKTPLWQFYRFDELMADHSNWVGPNAQAVLEAFASAGFDIELVGTHYTRGHFRGRIKPGAPEFLTIPSGEGVYYDTLISHLFSPRKQSA